MNFNAKKCYVMCIPGSRTKPRHHIRFSMLLLATVLVWFSSSSIALDNGLALTPPMGWLSWERFRCNVDCTADLDNCIGEKLIQDMTDRMATDGYKQAGYQYVIIDDCWLAKERASDGQLQPDPERFPSGMRALGDYIHSKGLKFGLYEDFGTRTCAGYPGSEYYMQMDMQTFADWGVDYLKLDGCNSDPHAYGDDYPPFQFFLNMTGRPIVYSSEFALHQLVKGVKPNYVKLAEACNLVRNGDDITDSWESVKGIIDQYGKNEGGFADLAKPGYFNDADELIIGNFGLSWEQQRTHMAMWCMFASPLLMSVDLRTMNPQSKALLLNKYALAVNQDPLGKQGKLVKKLSRDLQLWTKPIRPAGSVAFTVINLSDAGMPSRVNLQLADLAVNTTSLIHVREVFENKPLGTFRANDTIPLSVNPTGVFFGTAVAVARV